MRYILLALAPLIFTGCQAEKLADAVGFHMEMDIDKPSDSAPPKALLSDQEVEEMIKPKNEVEEVKK